jgi:hypothetical protein
MVGQEDWAHSASAPPHVREYLSIVCANLGAWAPKQTQRGHDPKPDRLLGSRCAAQRREDRHA